MYIFYEPHKRLLHLLLQHKIDFLLIGGYAVNFYGYNRPTGDMDIWLKPTDDTKKKFLDLLKQEEFSHNSIEHVAGQDFTKGAAFYFGEMPLRIDFLTRINGVNFPEAWVQRTFLSVDNNKVPVIHLHHLILSKISTQRTKDKLDVEELQKLEKQKKKK